MWPVRHSQRIFFGVVQKPNALCFNTVVYRLAKLRVSLSPFAPACFHGAHQ